MIVMTREPHALSSGVGLMIVDGAQRILSRNADAVQILCYPAAPRPSPGSDRLLAGKVSSLLDPGGAPRSDGTTEFLSGRRRYKCRTVPLNPEPGSRLRRQTAIVLERRLPPRLPETIPAQYGLTRREQEVVELLMQGLTSKEIAARKSLSPNTVKSFLRLIMVKMGVKSRAAIVGRLFAAVMTPPV